MATLVFTVEASGVFCSSVQLAIPNHPCGQPHGYTYQVTAAVQTQHLDEHGFAIDYDALQGMLSNLCAALDHQHLNDHPAFQQRAPSCEHVAAWFHQQLCDKFSWITPHTLKIEICTKPGVKVSVTAINQ